MKFSVAISGHGAWGYARYGDGWQYRWITALEFYTNGIEGRLVGS